MYWWLVANSNWYLPRYSSQWVNLNRLVFDHFINQPFLIVTNYLLFNISIFILALAKIRVKCADYPPRNAHIIILILLLYVLLKARLRLCLIWTFIWKVFRRSNCIGNVVVPFIFIHEHELAETTEVLTEAILYLQSRFTFWVVMRKLNPYSKVLTLMATILRHCKRIFQLFLNVLFFFHIIKSIG